MNIRHVIFDWSGTLFNDHRPGYLATRDIFVKLAGIDISFKDYKKYFKLPAVSIYRRYGIKTPFKKINEIYFKIYENYYRKGSLFDGVIDVLKTLKKQGIQVSVFSTVRQDLIEDLVKAYNLESYITNVTGSVCDKRKEMKGLLQKIKCQPAQILFIGDMEHDIQAAKKNGLISGCVNNGYSTKEILVRSRPRFMWQTQRDLVPFLKKISQKKNKAVCPLKYPVSTVGALIFNTKGEALFVLTHKWGFTYGIPGGKIKKGESADAALKRELLEETGLDIIIKELIVVQDCIASREFYIKKTHFILFNYLACAKSGVVQLNNEAVSFLWLDPRDALNLTLNEPTRYLLKVYLQKAKKKTLAHCR
ncbi:MAG: HAD hydrolase-like protein [Deltaproteobacteria bacterium]|nr:HAD hydrolase-like protein [Deltaproteobacteria bacterium]